ncbi:MAG: rhodanese-like domain-containing protein [Deltaproteobacteria bacterium]|nr:rhodanese-like domain-containing protein [Deltaproteobacteria bacterium]
MYFEQIRTPGLGCFSYAVGCPPAGAMAVVDPRRDIDVYLRIAENHGMRITHIFETHVHADHVSGAQELRASTNADIYIHENAPVGYEAKKLKNGDEFKLGAAALRVLCTPGHTPDSVSFLVSDLARSPEPEMILTGDLLFVGDIGRPDLPGEKILDEQVENLYNSLYKTLGPLPDYLEVYPAHGQGSLCGQGMSAKPSSTLGYERLANPMLKYSDFNDFKRVVLSNLPMRPQSFSSIISANLKGAALFPKLDLAEYALSADKTDEFRKAGAILLDLRDTLSHGAAHIPGSINIDFSGGPVLNWVGLAVSPNIPLVLILPAGKSFEEIYTELRRIGYDDVKGWLLGGLKAWLDGGRKTQSLKHISASDLRARLAGPNPPALLDVRSPAEFNNLKIEGSINLTFDRILEKDACPVTPETEAVVVCQSGFRAGIAASLLQARGCTDVSLLTGGMNAWKSL